MRGLMILVVSLGLCACKRAREDNPPAPAAPGVATAGSAAEPARPRGAQVTPPVDLKAPPADAVKTASGLIYKKLVSNDDGAHPGRNDVVLVNYTGWRQATGETFFSNRGRGQPMPLNLAQSAPGFAEALPLLRKGEKAVLWLPPSIGYKAPPAQGEPETLVYEIEVVDFTPAPAIPADVAQPPANAESLPSGAKLVVVRSGTGKDKARPFDVVTFNYTAWASDGRMLDTTEAHKRPVTGPPYKQAGAMESILTQMTAGQRVRFWVDAAKMVKDGKPVGGVKDGVLCYELEILQIVKAQHEPPLAPPDVAKPPAGAKQTDKGVFYRVLKSGAGKEHPTSADSVKVHYTGWTTDGRMFDSSELRGEPATFALTAVVAGWTDGLQVMTTGDRVRFWIPEALAYKGMAGKPAGMLVFDVELLEINPEQAPGHGGGHGKHPH